MTVAISKVSTLDERVMPTADHITTRYLGEAILQALDELVRNGLLHEDTRSHLYHEVSSHDILVAQSETELTAQICPVLARMPSIDLRIHQPASHVLVLNRRFTSTLQDPGWHHRRSRMVTFRPAPKTLA